MFSIKRAAHTAIAILSASVAVCASAQTPAAEPAKCIMQNFASLALHDDGLNVSADGSINGDKAAMLIDSGAPNTMVTRTEAVKLGLGLTQPAPSGKGGKPAEDYRVPLSEFAVGSIEMGSTRILASQRLSDYPDFGALIGADFLMQHDMELSLATRQLKFFNPVGCDKSLIAYWDSNAAMVPLAAMSATDRRPVVTVEIDGQTLRALVDSGTPISVVSLSAAARTGVTPKSHGVTPMKATAPGARPTSWVAPFRRFSIGGEEVKNLKLPILDLKNVINAEPGTAVPDMILGQDFLRAHHVLFASSQQSFYFSYVGGSVFNMDLMAPAPAAAPAKP